MASLSFGDVVRVGESVGSALRGRVATVVAGPERVGGVAGVYTVAADGVREQHHGSRLAKLAGAFILCRTEADVQAWHAAVAEPTAVVPVGMMHRAEYVPTGWESVGVDCPN